MSGRVLLDTNMVIALFAKEAVVQQRLAAADEVFVSSIVLGELYYGAQKSSRVDANLARVNTFAAANTILVCDTATAQYYGAVKNHLRATGHPIPENDIWIAATAKQHQLTLVTRDGHFQAVEGLLVEQW
ncbi:MAG: type II toxin-antitoxin system VapC family toxin [Deltaproteobacteria bacterium]|nr:type II toxin-antitoxin system VapC family toxin [Deltaproteobacteria bacterium]